MRKKVFGRKLSREIGSRTALFRSLVKALVDRGQIVTTKPKAKAVQPLVEKLMTKVAKGDMTAKRLVLAKLGNDRSTADKLFGHYASLTKTRKSGFTRIITLPTRVGDRATLARLEFVEQPEVKEEKKAEKKKKVAAKESKASKAKKK